MNNWKKLCNEAREKYRESIEYKPKFAQASLDIIVFLALVFAGSFLALLFDNYWYKAYKERAESDPLDSVITKADIACGGLALAPSEHR